MSLLQYSQAIKNIFPNWTEFNAVITTGIILTDLTAGRSHARRRSSLTLKADHLILEWGGGGVADFEKKFPSSPCRKKKIACSTNVIESLLEKKGKKISCPPDY